MNTRAPGGLATEHIAVGEWGVADDGCDRRSHAARRVRPVIHHMLRHLNEPLRISALSAIAGVSPSHFFTVFRSATGGTPIDFLIRLRVRLACKLLRNRRLSIKQAAGLLGYHDPFYFSRVFKSVMGVAPRNYRDGLASAPKRNSSGARAAVGDDPGRPFAQANLRALAPKPFGN